MPVIDMSKIEQKYPGQWVALNEGRTKVVGFGHTIKEALAESKKKGVKDPILTKVPTESLGYLL